MVNEIGQFGQVRMVARIFENLLKKATPKLRKEFEKILLKSKDISSEKVSYIEPHVMAWAKKCTCGKRNLKKKKGRCCTKHYSYHDITVDVVEIKCGCEIIATEVEKLVLKVFTRVIANIHNDFGQECTKLPDSITLRFGGIFRTLTETKIEQGCQVVSVRICRVGVLHD